MADDKSKADAKPPAEAAAPAGGGIKAMLPLILTIVLMPVLALVMTQFVLVPKLQQAITASATTTDHGGGEGEAAVADGLGGEAGKDGKGAVSKGAKTTVPLPKIIVNVKDTQATRYLMSSYTLVGQGEDFKTLLEANMDQVRDVASGVLGSKNIRDLEKPDARNIIKAELISTINTALGKPAVKEIYITDFAIQ
jgi:flagellar basal body-associated protein FliL